MKGRLILIMSVSIHCTCYLNYSPTAMNYNQRCFKKANVYCLTVVRVLKIQMQPEMLFSFSGPFLMGL